MIRLAAATAVVVVASGCASISQETVGPPRKENLYAVTLSHQLVSFNAGTPQKIASKKALSGLQGGEEIVGIDYRVARGLLYALTNAGRIYLVDTPTGALRQVGDRLAVDLVGQEFGFDFNPAVDRIRIVSDGRQNLRAHPDTGAVVDSNISEPGVQIDRPLVYGGEEASYGRNPQIMAAAYTYNKVNDKATTNYAIDGALDLLVTQGSKEGETPVVSPNTGLLFTVGSLGVGQSSRVSFDISDVNNAAYGAFLRLGSKESRLYSIDLATGRASFIGTIAVGEPIRGMAIEP